MKVTTTDTTNASIEVVVDLHRRAFPDFSDFFGPRFLRELYLSFISDPQCVCLMATDSETGETLGFAAGPLQPNGYFRKLVKRRWLAFGIASLPSIVRRPTVISRITRGKGQGGGQGVGTSLAG